MNRRFRRGGLILLLSLVAGIPAVGQLGRGPGRSPFPGGGGIGGVGLPPAVPGGGRQGRKKAEKPPEEPLGSFTGVVKTAGAKNLTIEAADANTVAFVCSKKTKFYDGSKKIKASSIKTGDLVSVEARRGLDGTLEAVNVRREHPKPS